MVYMGEVILRDEVHYVQDYLFDTLWSLWLVNAHYHHYVCLSS